MKLLILDSITPLISPILGGGQAQGHMLMMEIGRILKRLAFEHNIVTVVSFCFVFTFLPYEKVACVQTLLISLQRGSPPE